ncbi:aspartate-semialdehyde dehydrogenase [Candidatus Microgenomates bacterium]|nr:MAG: aspartate-semialdehyde dehydrogenase [Candidatus Microgenomates bacterium]
MKKINVGILGATGAVGQRFVELLANHPWFNVTHLCASEKSSGKKYKDVVNWKISSDIPANLANLTVNLCEPNIDVKVIFSALDSTVAGEIEENFAKKGYIVISNSKNHRMANYVPLLIPEVNPDHLALVEEQQKRLKSKGFIITNPNCTTVGLAMVLKPLNDLFGIKQVIVTSMQALSGAGYPGVPSLDIIDNVIPYISGEEEKMETEPLKLLGKVSKNGVISAKIAISAQCNRVAVREGHLESVTISFEKKPTLQEVIKALKNFTSVPQKLKLPSAPQYPIIVREEANRPQPVVDRNEGNGMSVVVGRVNKSEVFDIKLTLLVHNTIRGAAGAAILNAELLKVKNFI